MGTLPSATALPGYNVSIDQWIELSPRYCYTGLGLWSYLEAVHKLFASQTTAGQIVGRLLQPTTRLPGFSSYDENKE